jgi:hypothetical protein
LWLCGMNQGASAVVFLFHFRPKSFGSFCYP